MSGSLEGPSGAEAGSSPNMIGGRGNDLLFSIACLLIVR